MKNVEWQFTIYVEGNILSLAKRKLPVWVIGEINTYMPARTWQILHAQPSFYQALGQF